MNYKTVTLVLSTLIAFAGCSDSKTEEVKIEEPLKINPVETVKIKTPIK